MLFEADDKPDPKKEDEKLKTDIEGVAENVATLRVPSILEALHLNALAKCGAAKKKVELVNSAFTGKNGKVTLESAGELLISVVPTPEAKDFKKADAIAILKAYVLWFVGPDLANKVNDSTVKALDESPELKESRSHFMSFKQFLFEADEKEKTLEDTMKDGENNPEETKEEKPAEGEDGKEKTLEDTMKDGENQEKKDDKKDEEDALKGYYISYGLKVEGLKQTALKDAMKKAAKTFFDDLKFTASGLFGGSDSFTVKDVKDKWNEAFGPIDPDDLVDKVRKLIEDISHPNTDRPEVKIRDKTTLIQDLGSNISGKLKQQIDGAEYSIWIEVSEFDPKKPIFNKRVVADIVTSSVKGLWKKFANKITADDVIYLEDFADTHEDTTALKALQGLVKNPKEIEAIIDRESKTPKSTANTTFKKIQDIIDPIEKDKQYKNSQLAQACVKVFKEFEHNHSNVEELSKIKSNKIKELFKGFLEAYEKAYKKYYDKKLEESISKLNLLKFVVNLKKLVLESLLDEAKPNEDENAKKPEKEEKPVKYSDIKSYIDSYVLPKPTSTSVGEKQAIIDACKLLDPALESAEAYKAFKDTDTYNSGILVDYTGLAKAIKSLNESFSLKDDILNILLGDDLLNEVEDSKDKKKSKKKVNKEDSNAILSVDEKLLLNTLTKALTDNGVNVNDIEKNLIKLSKKVMSESIDFLNEGEPSIKSTDLKKPKSQPKPKDAVAKDAYILPFNVTKVEDEKSTKTNDIDDPDINVTAKGRKDVYIVPMKGLRYKDKEYNTYA